MPCVTEGSRPQNLCPYYLPFRKYMQDSEWTSFFQLLLIEIIAKLTDRCSDLSVEVEPSLSKAEAHLGYITVRTLQ